MTQQIFRRDGIAISVGGTRAQPGRYVLEKWQSFVLETPGVYTLEGENQAGKSLLIKHLMGVLPPRVREEGERGATYVDGEAKVIRSVVDAHKAGLVAVFQDDKLIPSMSVWEQILTRHQEASFRYALEWTFDGVSEGFRVVLGKLPLYGKVVAAVRRRIFKGDFVADRNALRERAVKILNVLGMDEGILDRVPRELSGGAAAVARLLNVLLTPYVRVLFLDEAFAGVQASLWPKIVDFLRRWRDEQNAALVVVSHNVNELLRWQPRLRFVVEQGEISTRGVRGYMSLLPGLPERVQQYPVFGPPYDEPWLERFTGPFLILADSGVNGSPGLVEIKRFLTRMQGSEPRICTYEATEQQKNLDNSLNLVRDVLSAFPSDFGTIVVVGGGVFLNMVSFCLSILRRGRYATILVPTTVMAMADVAVGSKTAVNYTIAGLERFSKHLLGTYHNPSAIILDFSFLESLPAVQRRRGLVECLKHGLLQDGQLYKDVLSALGRREPQLNELAAVISRVVALKVDALAADPWEGDFAQILLYGHRHSAALEVSTSFQISHGEAVMWGILLDLELGGAEELKDSVCGEIQASLGEDDVLRVDLVNAVEPDRLLASYQGSEVGQEGQSGLRVICLDRVGEYQGPYASQVRQKFVSWRRVREAVVRRQEEIRLRVDTSDDGCGSGLSIRPPDGRTIKDKSPL